MPDARRPVFDATLAVVPSDPLAAYEAKGLGGLLQKYYNPLNAFRRVYCLSPFETDEREAHGMHVIPTSPADLPERLRALHVDVARAYGGYWPCTYLCAAPGVSVPRVVSVHDTNPELLHDEIRLADVIFAMSRAVRSCVVARGANPGRVRLLPNRIDLDVFRPHPGPVPQPMAKLAENGGRRVILHVGRKAPQKNIDTVIRAIACLGHDYSALFVGPGDAEPYRALAEQLGVADRCAFMGGVNNADLPAYYASASCVCIPSRWEGFGVVFIEALACGAAIVASNIAPLNEYMRHGHDALLVEQFEDPAQVAQAITMACVEDGIRERLHASAPAAALPFDRRAVDALEVGLYAEALGAARPEVAS